VDNVRTSAAAVATVHDRKTIKCPVIIGGTPGTIVWGWATVGVGNDRAMELTD